MLWHDSRSRSVADSLFSSRPRLSRRIIRMVSDSCFAFFGFRHHLSQGILQADNPRHLQSSWKILVSLKMFPRTLALSPALKSQPIPIKLYGCIPRRYVDLSKSKYPFWKVPEPLCDRKYEVGELVHLAYTPYEVGSLSTTANFQDRFLENGSRYQAEVL